MLPDLTRNGQRMVNRNSGPAVRTGSQVLKPSYVAVEIVNRSYDYKETSL